MKLGLPLVILFNFCLTTVTAQYGNYRFNNFGNRSILLAGNVTGSVSDIGLAYYNPSFLADNENVGISLNAKAYQLVNFKLNNVLDEDSSISSSNFNGTGTMAGGIFNLFGTKFAYSYLTKSNNSYNLNYNSNYLNDEIQTLFPNAIDHNAKIGLNFDLRDDWTGLTWAYKINDKLSLGISGFASIFSDKGRSDLSHVVESTDDEVAYYNNIINYRQKSYGVFIKIGANYKFESFDLGLNMNLPYLSIYNEGSFSYTEVVSGVSPEFNKYIDQVFRKLDASRKVPMGISIGAGIPMNNAKIHLNFDYVSALGGYDRIEIPDIDTGDEELTPVNFYEERKAVFNFGIGAEYLISEKLKAYGGFSTDFNALNKSASIFDLSAKNNKNLDLGADFYHLSMGVNLKLSWVSLVMGITYTEANSSFLNPYRISADGFEFENDLNSELLISRWQFVVGIDIPFLETKVKNLTNKKKSDSKDD